MAFDDLTRGRLQDFVTDARRVLSDEFTRQFQNEYGLDPTSGAVADLSRLHLDDARLETARVLREILTHYQATSPDSRVADVLNRMVREQSFTVLNRLVALRMMEARGLLISSISQGYESQGFQLYTRMAGTGLGDTYAAYRCYLGSLFDEFATELPALFGRFSAQGLLFPGEQALLKLVGLINFHEIAPLWSEDEAIGWVYQYFNSKEERKKMRDASAAPRDSRELAVRNQFFTPRYVVEFLVDNTLGRLWLEMTRGQTALAQDCLSMLLPPNAIFEQYPTQYDERPSGSNVIAFRQAKDPRDIRFLDPACGSMHFGLYAFDLFGTIYREAWHRDDLYVPEGMRPLRESYQSEEAYQRDVPRLIIEYNLYGVDIDPRAAQIASLALWLRAQRSWHDSGVKAKDRPVIGRGNVVAAVAPPAEPALREEFAKRLEEKDAVLFSRTLDLLRGLPEMGVLLRIERKLRELVADVFWGHGPMFADENVDAWTAAEQRLREALTEFSHIARSTVQARLFAQDALDSLRLIDLVRLRFDVITQNPPFGSSSLGAKAELTAAYPDSKNDLLAIFIDRSLELLWPDGLLGAITSRTCFFLSSFTDWREKVVLSRSAVDAIADLGQGVMDAAMVEAAAYVLRRASQKTNSVVLRVIADSDRRGAMASIISSYRHGVDDHRLFSTDVKALDALPGAPFAYWIDKESIERLALESRFEPDVGEVRVGLQTGDDPRFVRAVWEVSPEDTQFCYYPTDGSGFCAFDDPVVQGYMKRRHRGTPNWAFHVKAGASQPWYSPITLKLNYRGYGNELRGFRDAAGKPRAFLRSTDYYYRPGFSWTRRAVRFFPYVIPGNCIPSVSRYMAFPELGRESDAIGVCASRIASSYMRLYAEFWQRPNFLVENLKALPWPKLDQQTSQYLKSLVDQEVAKRRKAYQNFEPFHEFLVPLKVQNLCDGGAAVAFEFSCLLGEEGERLIAQAYGLDNQQALHLERDLREALAFRRGLPDGASDPDEDGGDDDSDFVLDVSPVAQEVALMSYLVGCVFGRWDIRYATGQASAPALDDPFAPMPVCPPGMLQGIDGLPLEPMDVPVDYPLDIAWPGVLSGDIEQSGNIVERVQEALNAIWGAQAEKVEEQACAVLGVKVLAYYFSSPTRFFADHLKCYSKSGRKAPIYWPLSTASGSYTLWLYYPRISHQTLHTALVDFVAPKLDGLAEPIAALRAKSEALSGEESRRLSALQEFQIELIEFRERLTALAARYQPNIDDGAIISAAPLWELFRHKPWQRLVRDAWAKLERGDFDWSHLAMNYWPDRVQAACVTDKSLAIAHGCEELYQPQAASGKGPGGRRKHK